MNEEKTWANCILIEKHYVQLAKQYAAKWIRNATNNGLMVSPSVIDDATNKFQEDYFNLRAKAYVKAGKLGRAQALSDIESEYKVKLQMKYPVVARHEMATHLNLSERIRNMVSMGYDALNTYEMPNVILKSVNKSIAAITADLVNDAYNQEYYIVHVALQEWIEEMEEGMQ